MLKTFLNFFGGSLNNKNMNYQIIKDYCEKKGYQGRGCRFKVIEDLLGITPKEAKKVETITRTIREIFPKDEVGAKKEAEWKMPDYMRSWENELNSLYKN